MSVTSEQLARLRRALAEANTAVAVAESKVQTATDELKQAAKELRDAGATGDNLTALVKSGRDQVATIDQEVTRIVQDALGTPDPTGEGSQG